MSKSTRTKHQPQSYPNDGLPLTPHDFTPASDNHRRGEARCQCGLPRRNRVHQVLPVPGVEQR